VFHWAWQGSSRWYTRRSLWNPAERPILYNGAALRRAAGDLELEVRKQRAARVGEVDVIDRAEELRQASSPNWLSTITGSVLSLLM